MYDLLALLDSHIRSVRIWMVHGEIMASVKLAFTGQVYDVRLKRNGGRIQIDFGVDAVEVINEISRLAAQKDMNMTFAVLIPELGKGPPDLPPEE